MAPVKLNSLETQSSPEHARSAGRPDPFRLLNRQEQLRRGRWGTAAVPGAPNDTVLRRDALYRRMLAAGDLVATSLALFIAVVVVSGGKLDIGSAIALPLVILLGKIVGLHDRDEHLLRKTTLEEVPTIVAVGTLLTFMIWLSNGASIDGELTRGQTELLWGLVVTLLVVTRTATRTIARGLVSEERCLVLGDEESARDEPQVRGQLRSQGAGGRPGAARGRRGEG